MFEQILAELKNEGAVPTIATEDGFNELESLKVGKRTIQVTLPTQIWHPRVVLWCQALQLMVTILSQGDS